MYACFDQMSHPPYQKSSAQKSLAQHFKMNGKMEQKAIRIYQCKLMVHGTKHLLGKKLS
jgi:hypothetical protein